LSRLEPDEVKVSRPVLRGRGGGNAASLPDRAKAHHFKLTMKWKQQKQLLQQKIEEYP